MRVLIAHVALQLIGISTLYNILCGTQNMTINGLKKFNKNISTKSISKKESNQSTNTILAANRQVPYPILQIIDTPVFLPESSSNVSLKEMCPLYDEILPDGVCVEYLQNKRIAQPVSWLKYGNNALKTFFNGIAFLKIWLKSGNRSKQFIRRWLGDCYNHTYIQHLLNNTDVITLKELQDCTLKNKKIICSFFHPMCFYTKDLSSIMSRPLCKESCSKAFTRCKSVVTFLVHLAKFLQLCPRGLIVRGLFLPDCMHLETANLRNIEKCQLFPDEKYLREKNVRDCFERKGLTYNGTINVTLSGRICLPWNTFNFLQKPFFSNLDGNYCRNPEGYGEKPWCYVDIKRSWEYCAIENCQSEKRKGDSSVKLNFVTIAISVGLFLSFLTTMSFLFYYKQKRKQNNESQIPYYNQMTMKSSSEVAEFMRENKYGTDHVVPDVPYLEYTDEADMDLKQ